MRVQVMFVPASVTFGPVRPVASIGRHLLLLAFPLLSFLPSRVSDH
jgi:hypothetical protein